MGVINATQAKGGTVVTSGPIGRLIGWIEHLFGASSPTVTAHGEPSRGNEGELEMTHDFGAAYDKTGGWDKCKKSGWSPHGDEGMR